MVNRYAEDNDRSPLTWWKGHPIYATTLLVIVHGVMMVLFSLLSAGNLHPVIVSLIFNSTSVIQDLSIWQVATYAFVNPPTINFAIEMVLLFMFGRQLEVFFGRRSFLRAYVILLLSAPLALLLLHLITPTVLFGSSALHFSVFVAFATLYPAAGIFFGIPAKWIAIVLLAINSLQALASHNVGGLIALWTTSVIAYSLVRLEQGRWSLPSLAFFQKKPTLHVLPKTEVRSKPRSETKDVAKPAPTDPSVVIDRLLDKITASGIQSLSEAERTQLEHARQQLLKRDR